MKDIQFNKDIKKIFKELSLFVSKHDDDQETAKKLILEREKRLRDKVWPNSLEIAFLSVFKVYPRFEQAFRQYFSLGYITPIQTRDYKPLKDLKEDGDKN